MIQHKNHFNEYTYADIKPFLISLGYDPKRFYEIIKTQKGHYGYHEAGLTEKPMDLSQIIFENGRTNVFGNTLNPTIERLSFNLKNLTCFISRAPVPYSLEVNRNGRITVLKPEDNFTSEFNKWIMQNKMVYNNLLIDNKIAERTKNNQEIKSLTRANSLIEHQIIGITSLYQVYVAKGTPKLTSADLTYEDYQKFFDTLGKYRIVKEIKLGTALYKYEPATLSDKPLSDNPIDKYIRIQYVFDEMAECYADGHFKIDNNGVVVKQRMVGGIQNELSKKHMDFLKQNYPAVNLDIRYKELLQKETENSEKIQVLKSKNDTLSKEITKLRIQNKARENRIKDTNSNDGMGTK